MRASGRRALFNKTTEFDRIPDVLQRQNAVAE